VYALSAFVNVAANAVLVPRWGAAGAAVATVLCEWLNLALVVRLLRDAFGVRLSTAGLWRYGAAIAVMLAALALARPLGVIAAIPVAAAAYATALWAFGYTRSADHLLVKRLLVEEPQGGRR